jgi:DNA-binding LacI/PurR family transcriptional regulator
MAAAALRLLLGDLKVRRRSRSGSSQEIILDHELIVRESSGTAPR